MSLACDPVEAVERVEEVESERWFGVRPRVVRLRLSVMLIISSSSMSDRCTESRPEVLPPPL